MAYNIDDTKVLYHKYEELAKKIDVITEYVIPENMRQTDPNYDKAKDKNYLTVSDIVRKYNISRFKVQYAVDNGYFGEPKYFGKNKEWHKDAISEYFNR